VAVGERYQESGKFTAGGAAVAVVVAIVGGALTGFVYGIIDQVNPFIYINALGALFAGFMAAAAATFGGTMGKVRNGMVITVAAVVGGLACLYSSWVGFFFALSDWDLLAFQPDGLWALVNIANLKGVWSMKGSTPTGGFLWFIWGVEALMILGMAFIGGFGGLEDSPFCEACGVWADSETTNVLATPEDIEGMTEGMKAGDFAGLAALPAGDDKGVTWIEAKLEECPRQGAPHFLTVTGKARTQGDKGEEVVRDFPLVKLLEVDKSVAEIVKAGGAPVAEEAEGEDAAGGGEEA
jgi:hypothetical protein